MTSTTHVVRWADDDRSVPVALPVVRRDDGEFLLVVEPITGRLERLNISAAVIFDACDNVANVGTIIDALSTDLGVDRDALAVDVRDTLSTLELNGLLVWRVLDNSGNDAITDGANPPLPIHADFGRLKLQGYVGLPLRSCDCISEVDEIEWLGQIPVPFSNMVLGVRFADTETGDHLRAVFGVPSEDAYFPNLPSNYSVAFDSEIGAYKLFEGHVFVYAHPDLAEVVHPLVQSLTQDALAASGLVRLKSAAVVIGDHAVVLPARFYEDLAGLAEAIEPLNGSIVVGSPIIGHDGALLISEDAAAGKECPADHGAAVRSLGPNPGSYRVSRWVVDIDEETGGIPDRSGSTDPSPSAWMLSHADNLLSVDDLEVVGTDLDKLWNAGVEIIALQEHDDVTSLSQLW